MFKKFTEKENVSGVQQLKSSVQKDIRRKLLESYPLFEPYLEQVLPKKETFKAVKCHDHVELLASANPNGEILFFKQRDGPWIPCLRLLHRYPFILPWQQVDKGAIKFVLSGANIMCPGLTSAGARMTPGLGADRIVAVMAEGKSNAVAIGSMKYSSEDVKRINKGVGVENLHYLNDGLWQMKSIK